MACLTATHGSVHFFCESRYQLCRGNHRKAMKGVGLKAPRFARETWATRHCVLSDRRRRIRRMGTDNQPVLPSLGKRIFLRSLGFGAGFAVVLCFVVGFFFWYSNRPKPSKPWNSSAIKGTCAEMGFAMQPEKDSFDMTFDFDLQNNTPQNYTIDTNNFTVMDVLADGGSLSKRSNYQTSDPTVEAPSFIPPQGKVRVTIKTSYLYPTEFTSADKNNLAKALPSVNRRLAEVDGFVLFDQNNSYRIDLPEGWKKDLPLKK
jgi:hypothetical protein